MDKPLCPQGPDFRHMDRYHVGTGLCAGVLFTVPGVIAWASGQPFIFPSLGPTAFVLAFERRVSARQGYEVVVSHLVGGVVGLAAYGALASGVALTADPAAFSADGFRLAASGVVSIVVTSWGMLATDAIHAPACATTLIVSLGLLSTPAQVGVIVLSVVAVVALHSLAVVGYRRVAPGG